MRQLYLGILAAGLSAAAALAHQGVQNPVVLERMNGMTAMSDDMEILVNMARGNAAFDAARVDDALARLAGHAGQITGLFEEYASDPASESRDEIWEDYADFSAKAEDLETEVRALLGTIDSREALRPAMQSLGAACAACHDLYRED